MYVWEMIACRLKGEGWSVWHSAGERDHDMEYTVHYYRPGIAGQARAATLTEAYADAARRAHRSLTPVPDLNRYNSAPHFSMQAVTL